jgi:hypothetical protein
VGNISAEQNAAFIPWGTAGDADTEDGKEIGFLLSSSA